MTDERGSRRTETQVAPTRAATARVSVYPGRCPARRPATTPRKIAGPVGPPRKLPSEMLHAPALNRSRRASVESGTAEDVSNRVPKAS
jgi:hypothetical protein